jgi:hypothetical protein
MPFPEFSSHMSFQSSSPRQGERSSTILSQEPGRKDKSRLDERGCELERAVCDTGPERVKSKGGGIGTFMMVKSSRLFFRATGALPSTPADVNVFCPFLIPLFYESHTHTDTHAGQPADQSCQPKDELQPGHCAALRLEQWDGLVTWNSRVELEQRTRS